MSKIDKSSFRTIVEDLAKEIAIRKTSDGKPDKTVIAFRDDKKNSKERQIWEVPINLLRYRKDNGRIATTILSYEKNYGPLDETTKKTQEILFDALSRIDEKKNKELCDSIKHQGQDQEAIITCDGFLINGNRRKMAFENIAKEEGKNPELVKMKVVILPGNEDPGGPPTLLEIEQIENKYQFQSEAKAEYYFYNRALSMRRKIDLGMSLEEQLRDDPIYAGLDDKNFKKAVRKMEEDFLDPLESIDRYLKAFDRDGLYDTISKGPSDKEGRWEGFLEYSKFYRGTLNNQKQLVKLGIDENEIGEIEDTAFKLLRKRDLSGTGIKKTNLLVRELKKWVAKKDSKKELLKISKDVEIDIDDNKKIDKNGNEHPPSIIDKIWGEENNEVIINQVKKAIQLSGFASAKETPIILLEAALKKLDHDEMAPKNIPYGDGLKKALKLAEKIEKRANEIRTEVYNYKKNLKDLNTKKGR